MKRVLLLLYFAFFLQRTLSPMGIPCIYLHIEICRYIIYIYISKQILSRNSCWREISIASVCSALPLLSDSFSTMICYLSIPSQPIRDWCISNKSISFLFLQYDYYYTHSKKKVSCRFALVPLCEVYSDVVLSVRRINATFPLNPLILKNKKWCDHSIAINSIYSAQSKELDRHKRTYTCAEIEDAMKSEIERWKAKRGLSVQRTRAHCRRRVFLKNGEIPSRPLVVHGIKRCTFEVLSSSYKRWLSY